MRAVPRYMREGSYAMGATKLQTALRVVVPGAFSGLAAAYILGISRAVGETMVVAIAAGMQPNLTFNPASRRRRSPPSSCRSASVTCHTAASATRASSRRASC